MAGLAWVDGIITSLEEAKVPLHDRGYFFGDGIYEVIKVYNGRPFTLNEHLKRLERSLMAIGINPNLLKHDIAEIIQILLEKSRLTNAYIYIQVTRGIAPRSHKYAMNLKPFLTLFIDELHDLPNTLRENGVSAITVPDDRWAHPNIKTINLIPNVLAKQKAHQLGAFEAIFVRNDQTISEGTSSNVFAVFGNSIVTPPTNGKILAGITRSVVLDYCRINDFTFIEREITYNEVTQADELFITSTSIEILGVTRLDNKSIGRGKNGFVTQQIFNQYMQYVKTSCFDS